MRIRSSVENDLMDFLPVLLGIIFGILLIAVVVLVVVKAKQNSGPLKKVSGSVVDKTRGNIGESWLVIQTTDGQRLRLRALDARHHVCVGDRGVFEYRSETLNQFTPSS